MQSCSRFVQQTKHTPLCLLVSIYTKHLSSIRLLKIIRTYNSISKPAFGLPCLLHISLGLSVYDDVVVGREVKQQGWGEPKDKEKINVREGRKVQQADRDGRVGRADGVKAFLKCILELWRYT